jgi:hypothetical protein
LGSLAGAALFPTQLPAGPQLTDNRTTTSTVGGPVPIIFGTACVSGTVIWLAPYVESENDVGSKGGPEQEQYSYQQSIAIALCEAPRDGDTAIGGVSRIWENGTLVYDIRPQQGANTQLGLIAETDQEYANRLTASAAYAETFVLYLGSEDQEPDPTIEALQGVGATPAFRGLAYVVYPLRLLQTAQAWRHPNFKFEVYQAGTGNCSTVTEYSNSVLYPWNSGANDPTNELNINTFHIVGWDTYSPNYGSVPWPGNDNSYPTLEAALAYVAPSFNGSTYEVNVGYAIPAGEGDVYELAQAPGNPSLGGQYHVPDPGTVALHFNWEGASTYFYGFPDGGEAIMSDVGAIFHAKSALYQILGPYTGYPEVLPPLEAPWNNVTGNPAYGWPNAWFVSQDTVITVHRDPAPPIPICEGLPAWPQGSGFAVRPDGTLIRCGDWVPDTVNSYYVLQQAQSSVGGDQTAYKVTYPLNPVLRDSDPGNTEAFWTAAYNEAVSLGQMSDGMTYNPDAGGAHYPVLQSPGFGSQIYSIDYTVCEGGGAQVSLASIISALCERAGLSSIDVSDLVTSYIDGYAISTVTDAASIITPLRSVGFFDAVESGTTLRFQTRGKPIVATLTTDDIGCYDGGGNDDKVPPSVTVARADESTLPRSIRLHYVASSRDYESGEQDSPFRLTTTAVNDVDVSLPMVLGDTQALQAAEVLWADAWAAQNAYSTSVDQSWSALEPGDCIGVPVDSVIQRIRIVSDSNASGVLRKLQCVRDSQGAFISFAVATPPQRLAQTLTLLCGTAAEYLDLPALRDADNDPGFYVAAQRIPTGNTWKGCVIYESTDGGVTFKSLFALTTEATIGTLQAAVPASPYFTWDDSTEILVNVASPKFTFESISDAAVLAGGNAAAMGADGRWEVIQFANAELVSATQWKLSRLLRGRRGTEHVLGSSRTGDTFVMLSTGDLNRVVLSTAEIGASRVYKAVSIGATYGSGTNTTFTGHAEALLPFSPVDVGGELQTDGDLLIVWTRRDRLGRTLMSGVDMPLSEATLAFQVDIMTRDVSPEVVLRTLSVTTTQALYTHAQMETDFGDIPELIDVRVYQMSAIVGRGTVAEATLSLDTPSDNVSDNVSENASDHSSEISSDVAPRYQIAAGTAGLFVVSKTTEGPVYTYYGSSDGLTWTDRGIPDYSTFPEYVLGSLTLLDDVWYCVQNNTAWFWKSGDANWYDTPWSSSHLTTLPTADVAGGFTFSLVNRLNGEWVSWCSTGSLLYEPIVTSSDYVTWVDKAAPVGIPYAAETQMYYANILWDATNSRYLVFGTEYDTSLNTTSWNLFESTDLVNFTEITAFKTASLTGTSNVPYLLSVAQNGEQLVAVGFSETGVPADTAQVMYSADSGTSWTLADASGFPGGAVAAEGITNVVWDGGAFVGVAYGYICHSTDGGATWTWTAASVAAAYELFTNGDGAILIQEAGEFDTGSIQTSTDHGVTFTYFSP